MTSHIPVLINQVIRLLNPEKGKVFIDATIGLGGHAEELLKTLDGTGAIYGIDADERNLNRARERLTDYSNVHFIHGNFENLEEIGKEIIRKEKRIDGILLDLGLSSPHIEEPERGFSFQREGPLDMRFDIRHRLTAADIINTYSLEDLTEIFKIYGEERFSFKIAQEIIRHRKRETFKTTTQLADFIANIFPPRRNAVGGFKIHPSTRVFQALRIAVNREIEVLKNGLEGAAKALSSQGRLVVISYHSLEDRVVKNFFRTQKHAGTLSTLTKKPIRPDQEELMQNRRSRSARLRAAEKNMTRDH